MSITLSLSPEASAELERQAAAAGMDITSFVLHAVQEKLEAEAVPAVNLSFDEWSRDFLNWVASHSSRNPDFDDSRESIYD